MLVTKEPKIYTIGLTNVCNLKCPLCITGINKQDKPLKFMEYKLFEEIILKIKDSAKMIELYNWGESLRHKDIERILELCNKYNLNTVISSNLSIKEIDTVLEALVKYKLKKLIVSFDGISQEDYERYRIGGNFNLVLENIKTINFYKKKYNSEFPFIELQYLKNKLTTNQELILKEEYKNFGGDDYIIHEMLSIFKDTKTNVENWFEKDSIIDVPSCMINKKCHFLYNQMIIEQDGSIPPCCFTTEKKDDFNHWDNDKSILEMYNSKRFVESREMFEEGKMYHNNPCATCNILNSFLKKVKNV